MAILKEFREFAVRGNALDLAVGVVIGGAFGTIVKSLVDDIIMPPIGILLGNVDFSNLFFVLKEGSKQVGPYVSVAAAKEAGAITLNLGLFINAVISFTIIAFAVFALVKVINQLRREKPAETPEPDTKACPYCCSQVPVAATRCPQCTSSLD